MSHRLPTAVILDLDGTYADVEPYRHYVRASPPDYDAFHAVSCALAEPIAQTVGIVVEARAAGHVIVVMSGRNAKWLEPSREWLRRPRPGFPAGLPFDELHLDPPGPHVPDAEAKARMWDLHIASRYDVVLAVDDRPGIAAVWAAKGLAPERIVLIPGWNPADGP